MWKAPGCWVGRGVARKDVSGLEPLDPFLMLDHVKMVPDGTGFPDHPCTGVFEILTYFRQGFGSHKDNFSAMRPPSRPEA